MQEVVQQLGALLLGAVPTILLFLVLVLAYQFLVQGPLTATLKERRARTEGAVEDAQKAIALAEARAAEYADKLRQARADVYKVPVERFDFANAFFHLFFLDCNSGIGYHRSIGCARPACRAGIWRQLPARCRRR